MLVPDHEASEQEMACLHAIASHDLSDFKAFGGQSGTDLHLRPLLPAMLRFVPEVFRHFLVRCLAELFNRRGYSRARMADFLMDFAPCFDVNQIIVLRAVHASLEATIKDDHEAEDRIARTLLQLFDPEEREAFYLHRLSKWDIESRMIPLLEFPASAIVRLINRIDTAPEREQQILIWTLYSLPQSTEDEVARAWHDAAPALNRLTLNQKSQGRLAWLLEQYQPSEPGIELIRMLWRFSIDTCDERAEQFSAVLARHHSTTIDALFRRCSPNHWLGWCQAQNANSAQCAAVVKTLIAIAQRDVSTLAEIDFEAAFASDALFSGPNLR
jgi:hypothetical protein